MQRGSSQDSGTQRLNDFLVLFQCRNFYTPECAAVFFGNDNILGHIHQSSGQITRVSSFQGGIGQPFTGTVGRNKVFQNGQSFSEVRYNWVFNNLTSA